MVNTKYLKKLGYATTSLIPIIGDFIFLRDDYENIPRATAARAGGSVMRTLGAGFTLIGLYANNNYLTIFGIASYLMTSLPTFSDAHKKIRTIM